jgi:hypothetical protein
MPVAGPPGQATDAQSPPPYLAPMKLLLLIVALCCGAGPLRAQPQWAVRTDTTAAAPVRVPIPAAVRQACRRQLPEVTANPAAVWSAYADNSGFDFDVTTTLIRTDPRWQDSLRSTIDTISCILTATFEPSGHLRYFDREVAPDALPRPVRRAVQRVRQRVYANGEIVLIVGSTDPDNRRRHRRASYKVWLYNPQASYSPDWCDFWGNGRPIRHGPTFR